MNNHRPTKRFISLLVATVVLASPLIAQQRRNAAAKKPAPPAPAEPAPTFDTLLAADSYKIYVEVRGVGGLIRSSAVNDLLNPVMKLGGPNQEFKTIVTWLNGHADVLAGSRLLIAGWSSRPKLPNVLLAVEFSSPEEAKKFYPELSGFLPTLWPTPTPTPSPSPACCPPGLPMPATIVPGARVEPGTVTNEPAVTLTVVPQNTNAVAEAQPAPTPPYQMKLSGSLVLLSDTTFNIKDLRPRGAKPLEEEQNFVLARNRFASESVFLYVDLKTIEKEEKDRQKKYEEEEQKRFEAEAANPPKPEESPEAMETEMPPPPVVEQPSPPTEPEPDISEKPTPVVIAADPQASNTGTLSAGPARGPDPMDTAFYSLYGALFGGESKWPEAVAAALAFEGDAYVLRALIINDAEGKPTAIPFAPQFVSGPALAPESPNIFPADTDLFASSSLDYAQIYEGMLKSIAQAEERARKYSRRYNRGSVSDDLAPESPFVIYEKKLGLKIKDDIIPLLGNELAVALPKRAPIPAASPASDAEKTLASGTAQNVARPAEPSPIVAIAIKDREAVARVIPKIIESLGFKGANLFAQTEKRDGTEFVSYGGLFAYAFVGNFLVVGADAAATRHVVDAYLDHQTLSSDSHFRNFTRWQPRQVLGQLYMAPGLVEQYNPIFGNSGRVNDKMSELLSQVNPVIDPLTYALSNDGQGPLHELHVPKNLLLLMVAGASNETSRSSIEMNENRAKTILRLVARSEDTFKSDKGDGRYGTLDELVAESLISKELLESNGYRTELTVSGTKFEVTAVPIEYGKTGRLSYFIDESGVLRAGDHGGGAATVADQPPE